MLYLGEWSLYSKKGKLDILKDAIHTLDRQLEQERQARMRLMAHLGLVELDGPYIVSTGSQAVTPRVE